jgi:hypothetical protein
MKQSIKDFFKVSSIPVVLASLCCLSPIILVALGLATVSFASSLADVFYGQYKWYFRAVGFVALVIAYIVYVRRQVGVCTIDEAVKRRNELINKFMIFLIGATLTYVFFLYVVVHYIGVWLGLWG